MELRNIEIRADEETLKLQGLAVVFNQTTKIGNITEIIKPDALRNVDLSDVVLITNHDGSKLPLARTPKTMQLDITEKGLEFTAELPNTERGKDLYNAVKRGDITQMSFAFDISNADFDEKTQLRTINEISKIYEISAVTHGAYKQTNINARSENNDKMDYIMENLKNKPENTRTTATPEYRTAFYKSMLGKELQDAEIRVLNEAKRELRADTFNTLSSNANVVPDNMLNQILSGDRPTYGLINQVRKFSVPANLQIPIGTPTDPASWHIEGAVVDRNSISTTSITFGAFELMKIMSLSAAAQKMSISAFESFLTSELRNSMTDALCLAIINGTGTGQPTGLLTGITWNTTNTITTEALTTDLLLELITKLPQTWASGAKFAMSTTTLFANIYPIKDSEDKYIYTDAVEGGVRRIFGYEIVIDDNIPAGTILYGNYNYYGLNIPENIVLETSRESGFARGLIDFRALAIADAKPIIPEAFVKLVIEAA